MKRFIGKVSIRGNVVFLLRGETPGLREEIVILRVEFQHAIQVAREQILPADLGHPGKVVHLLVSLHVLCSFHAHAKVRPIEVPAAVLGDLLHPEMGRHPSHRVVLAIGRAYRQIPFEPKRKYVKEKRKEIRDTGEPLEKEDSTLPSFLFLLGLGGRSVHVLLPRFCVGVGERMVRCRTNASRDHSPFG